MLGRVPTIMGRVPRLTLLGLQSRFGGKTLGSRVKFGYMYTAPLKGSKELRQPRKAFGKK